MRIAGGRRAGIDYSRNEIEAKGSCMLEVTFVVIIAVAAMSVFIFRSFSLEGATGAQRIIGLLISLSVGGYFLSGLYESAMSGQITCRGAGYRFDTCYRKDGLVWFLMAQGQYLFFAVTSLSVALFLIFKRK